jgi:hypothetical protein
LDLQNDDDTEGYDFEPISSCSNTKSLLQLEPTILPLSITHINSRGDIRQFARKFNKKKKSKALKREKRRLEAQGVTYGGSQRSLKRIVQNHIEHSSPAEIFGLDISKLPATKPGFIGLRDTECLARIYQLIELINKFGYRLKKWDGRYVAIQVSESICFF